MAEWQAQAHGWSLRETVIALGPQRGHVGTPSGLADKFARFVRHGAIDGFNVTPYLIPDGLDDIVDLLVPELQERGSTAPSTPAPPCARTSACANPSRTGPRRTDGRRVERRDAPFHSGRSTHD
ncbi:hypothetical protein ACWEQH_26325 [Streptomyces sp. NPDC004166]